MHGPRHVEVGMGIAVVVALLLLVGNAQAQRSETSFQHVQQPDVFAHWQASLTDAADRALAAALTDRAWMNAPDPASEGRNQPAINSALLARVRAAVERVQRLRPVMEPILRQEGVPPELSALVLVESGGQPMALSPKGARGLWQLMPDTARRYGLVVANERDERLDIEKATRAAARYLSDLYQQFGDWELAFAAYNAGEQAVAKAAARVREASFSSIKAWLPKETRDYVPAVVRARELLGGMAVTNAVQSSRRVPVHMLYASSVMEDELR